MKETSRQALPADQTGARDTDSHSDSDAAAQPATSVQQSMFAESRQKNLYKLAQECAFDYADSVGDRAVFPTPDALDGLSVFEEPLSDEGCDGETIVRQCTHMARRLP